MGATPDPATRPPLSVMVLPTGMSTSQVESLRDHIMQVAPALGGDHTVRDGAIAYGNFTGFGDNPMSDDAFPTPLTRRWHRLTGAGHRLKRSASASAAS